MISVRLYSRISSRGHFRMVLHLHTLPTSSRRQKLKPQDCKRWISSNNEDKPRLQDNMYTIPNALSVARIAMSPAIVYTVVTGQNTAALTLFAAAGFTDFLDGQIARKFPSQRSLLGSILDPIGDKMLMGSTALSLWYTALMPSWLVFIILSRDVILLSGGLIVKYQTMDKFSPKSLFDVSDGTLEVKPGWHGKLNMCLQLGAVIGCLAAPVWSFQDSLYLYNYLVLTGVMGLYSLLQYILTYKRVIGKVNSRPAWMKETKR